MKQFDILPHTADFKIRVYGKTREELFKHACIGMFSVMGFSSPFCVKKNNTYICSSFPQSHTISITGLDYEMLLVNFLSEALYLADVYNEAYLDSTLHAFSENMVQATLFGVRVERFDLEIKAVTYNELVIKQEADTWQVDIVFDI